MATISQASKIQLGLALTVASGVFLGGVAWAKISQHDTDFAEVKTQLKEGAAADITTAAQLGALNAKMDLVIKAMGIDKPRRMAAAQEE